LVGGGEERAVERRRTQGAVRAEVAVETRARPRRPSRTRSMTRAAACRGHAVHVTTRHDSSASGSLRPPHLRLGEPATSAAEAAAAGGAPEAPKAPPARREKNDDDTSEEPSAYLWGRHRRPQGRCSHSLAECRCRHRRRCCRSP
jgi:hypothetical protein